MEGCLLVTLARSAAPIEIAGTTRPAMTGWGGRIGRYG
jgi:hypothetical protein